MNKKLLMVVLLATPLAPQSVVVGSGFLKGEDFHDADTREKQMYAMGVLDGMVLAPLFGAPQDDKKIRLLDRCTEGMTTAQITAIIDKYVRDHPERRNHSMNAIAYTAIVIQACAGK